MVLEATILCIDNSEYVRNSDYLPTRLQVRRRTATKPHSTSPNNPHPKSFTTLGEPKGKSPVLHPSFRDAYAPSAPMRSP
jgi:hypothetical protein